MHRPARLGILLVLATSFALAAERLPPPAFRASLVCFNGKDGSGTRCRSSMAKVEGGLGVVTGTLTCGFAGAVSDITWTYRGHKDGKDLYHVTRKFPSDTDHAATSEVDVGFDGKRKVLFRDTAQCVVVEVEPGKK